MAASPDTASVLQVIAEQVSKGLRGYVGVAVLCGPSHETTEVAAAGSDASQTSMLRQVAAADMICKKVASGHVVETGEVTAEVKSRSLLAANLGAARYYACAPLAIGQESMGSVWVARRAEPRFGQADANLLGLMGQQAALAVRSARVYDLEQRALADLRVAEQSKAEFLSAVAHDLRTPLTAITASAGLLSDSPTEPLSPLQQRLVRSIARNAGRLTSMVTDLLDLTRQESGRLTLTCELVDITAIVQASVSALRPLLDEKKQMVALHAQPGLPLVMADRRRVEQCLANLLSNAHRYAPPGGRIAITITAQVDTVTVAVSDNGPGVKLDERGHLFERFYRGSVGLRENPSGTGLGLAVARAMVDLHGGTIGYRTAAEGGAEFYFTLPIQGPEEPES